MKDYINELDKLRIHELRDLARKMGVQSPTTLKKEQIIDNIMEILSGKKEPYVNISKQGRPARNQDKSISFQDVFEENNSNVNYNVNQDFSVRYTLSQPSAKYEFINEEKEDVCGYLEIKKNFGIVRLNNYQHNDTDVIIPIQTVKDKNLKNGTFVKGKAPVNRQEHTFISNLELPNKSLFDFDKQNALYLMEDINQSKLNNLKFGGRYYFEKNNTEDLYKTINNLVNEIADNNNCLVRAVYIDAINELITNGNKNVENLVLPFNISVEDCLNAVNLFIEKCKREVEQNKNVVLIVCGFANLIKYFNILNNNNAVINDIDYNSILNTKNILYAAKCINKNASLTLINCNLSLMPSALNECLNYEIKPLFTQVY